MLQVDVGQIEMYTLHEQVGGDEHFFVGVGENGTVVADTLQGALVLNLYVFCETVDKAELTQFCNFHSKL